MPNSTSANRLLTPPQGGRYRRRRIALASQTVGIAALLVLARTRGARRFYLRYSEFIEFPQDSRAL